MRARVGHLRVPRPAVAVMRAGAPVDFARGDSIDSEMSAPPIPETGKSKEAGRNRRELARTGGMVLLAVLITLFAVLNLRSVKVDWMFGSGHAPLIIVIVVSLLVGIVLARFASRARRPTPLTPGLPARSVQHDLQRQDRQAHGDSHARPRWRARRRSRVSERRLPTRDATRWLPRSTAQPSPRPVEHCGCPRDEQCEQRDRSPGRSPSRGSGPARATRAVSRSPSLRRCPRTVV